MPGRQVVARRVSRCLVRRTPSMRVFGPDRTGLVAASSELLNRHGCTIVQSEHYTDRSNPSPAARPMFFQRILFEPAFFHQKQDDDDDALVDARQDEIAHELSEIASRLGVTGEIDWMRQPKRVAIMVSKMDHCLWELLLRHQANELQNAVVSVVLSNHEKCRPIAEDTFKIPYHCFPITTLETKLAQEHKQIDLLRQYNVDVVVMARYMQVLSQDFLSAYPDKIINIHHSFLPAFGGGRAYQQAHERGVKLIGATAHYATLDLDQGPIIEQDVIQVSHRDQVKAFVRKGQILERTVLVRALQAHLDNRVIVNDNKCVVFGD